MNKQMNMPQLTAITREFQKQSEMMGMKEEVHCCHTHTHTHTHTHRQNTSLSIACVILSQMFSESIDYVMESKSTLIHDGHYIDTTDIVLTLY
jgi:hypothetical protein